METLASLKNCPTSPRKMRLMADAIRGMDVYKALSMLKYSTRKESSKRLEKLILSGISNWGQKNELNPEEYDLYIKRISIDGGRQLKRFRPAPQGRAHRIRKRSNHINMVIDSRVAVANGKTDASTSEVEANEVASND